MITLPERYGILVVDDEPDVHAITRLSLRNLRYRERGVELMSAASGEEAIETMRSQPDTAVILLDVLMESMTAGLDACRTIREDLGNHFVRILLRTGQPGAAPESRVIEEYDIDGYLPKAELTATRLYSAVRTAIKAFHELVLLERHREVLAFVHSSVTALHAYEPLELTLQRILETAVAIAPSPLAVLNLETFETQGNPLRSLLYLSTDPDPAQAEAAAAEIVAWVAADPAARAIRDAGPFADGYLVPLCLHRDLGYGWIYLGDATPDEVGLQALPILAAHASNALYSTVAQTMLAAREGPFFDSITV